MVRLGVVPESEGTGHVWTWVGKKNVRGAPW